MSPLTLSENQSACIPAGAQRRPQLFQARSARYPGADGIVCFEHIHARD